MSAVSKKSTPFARAESITARVPCAVSVTVPLRPKLLHPRPVADTTRPEAPTRRCGVPMPPPYRTPERRKASGTVPEASTASRRLGVRSLDPVGGEVELALLARCQLARDVDRVHDADDQLPDREQEVQQPRDAEGDDREHTDRRVRDHHDQLVVEVLRVRAVIRGRDLVLLHQEEDE